MHGVFAKYSCLSFVNRFNIIIAMGNTPIEKIYDSAYDKSAQANIKG